MTEIGHSNDSTMLALVLDAFGHDLELREVPRPQLQPDQVLVRVDASGVNPLDTKIRIGEAPHARVTVPAILGIDLAGTVIQVGNAVGRRFAEGDQVYGMTGGVGPHQGSLAELVAVDPELLAHRPNRLSALEAATLPLAAITAWEALVDRAAVRAGHRVLVLGGAGGVGHIAVQLARARGARVHATDIGAGLEVLNRLGVEAVDGARPDLAVHLLDLTDDEGFDAILDTRGGPSLDLAFTLVRAYTGHVVSILGWGTHSLAPLSFRGATYSGVFTLLPLLTGLGRDRHGQILEAVAELVDDGLITPVLSSIPYSWNSVMDAHRDVETGRASGKVVVDLSRGAL